MIIFKKHRSHTSICMYRWRSNPADLVALLLFTSPFRLYSVQLSPKMSGKELPSSCASAVHLMLHSKYVNYYFWWVNKCTLCGGGIEHPHLSPASRRRRWKGNARPGVLTGPSFNWGTQMQGPGPPGWGLDARLTTLLCKKEYCCQIQISENRTKYGRIF
jgi:hypothetical protein